MSRRWAWGSADCGFSAWAVFARWHGYDPAPPFAYHTREAIERIVATFGGFVEMAEAVARRNGLARSPGRQWDIGTDGRSMLVCVGSQWIGKTTHGFGAVTGPIVRAWR